MKKVFDRLRPREDSTSRIIREIRNTLALLRQKELELNNVGNNQARRELLGKKIMALRYNFRIFNDALTHKPSAMGAVKQLLGLD